MPVEVLGDVFQEISERRLINKAGSVFVKEQKAIPEQIRPKELLLNVSVGHDLEFFGEASIRISNAQVEIKPADDKTEFPNLNFPVPEFIRQPLITFLGDFFGGWVTAKVVYLDNNMRILRQGKEIYVHVRE